VRLERAGEGLRCAVEDTGIGILPAQRERLFGRFVQADDARARHYQGAGLGLVLSRELARLMGGTLEVRSTAGEGSCFSCTLPLVPAPAQRAPAPAPRELPSGLRVLVVDDNAINRLVAQRLLERCGCQVASSEGGEAALEVLQRATGFDLVLMDVQMPGLDGLETTRRLRARHGEALRIVGCSASAESADLLSCRAAGMDDFLAKPITRERLVEALLRTGVAPPPPEAAALA
jgi:CheY-like chemotaxis protein